MPDPFANTLDKPILVAGFGSIGRRHFRNLRALGCTSFVFYRTHQGSVPDDESTGWPSFDNLAAALEHRPKIAVIANPTARHLEVATEAAEAGCDLFIEKPLSASLHGCAELAELVRERSLVATVGCQFRFHPLLVDLHMALAAGQLGRIVGARAEWGEYLPDWHPWEDHRLSYSARRDLGGGVVLTLIHPLDYLYWLFGGVDRVQAATRPVPALDTQAGEDWAEITLTFASGVIAQVHLDYLQRPPVHRLCVWGDLGSVTLDFQAGALNWQMRDVNSRVSEVTVPAGFERNTMFIDEMRHFLDCVATRRSPAVSLHEGIEVLTIALDAKQAARGGPIHA